MEWILAGLTFGFLGSFHCIGMCGPIALVLPESSRQNLSFFTSRLIYNVGRIVTYTTLGAAAGLISRSVSLGGYQQTLSIAIGILLLLIPFWRTLRTVLNRTETLANTYAGRLTNRIRSLFGSRKFGSFFLIGVLNGFLPCGFVYMALAAAVTLGDFYPSLIFMAGFGFGTVPAMLSVSFAGNLITVEMRRKLQKISPYFVAGVGVLLILRGLGLGIPLISPNM